MSGDGDPEAREVSFVGQLVPIVGYVGAGSEAAFYGEGQGPFGYVEPPDGATKATVAALIKGESLGTGFNGWLLFYDQRQDPPGDGIIGKLSVCGLHDGRVVVKWPAKGQIPGTYTLKSNTEPPMYDCIIEWAAVVTGMRPR